MFLKLYTNQIKNHLPLIRETLKRSLPACSEKSISLFVKEIMLGVCTVWLITTEQNEIRACFITKISHDIAVGNKTITIIAAYAPLGTNAEIMLEGYQTLKDFAKKQGCTHLDFYSSNPSIIRYAEGFDDVWKTNYFQIKI